MTVEGCLAILAIIALCVGVFIFTSGGGWVGLIAYTFVLSVIGLLAAVSP